MGIISRCSDIVNGIYYIILNYIDHVEHVGGPWVLQALGQGREGCRQLLTGNRRFFGVVSLRTLALALEHYHL